MIRRGLTCREVVERATDYFEACLPSEQSKRFAAHVEHCEGCQAHLRQLRITLDIVHTVADHEPVVPPPLLSAFREWSATGEANRDAG